MSLRPAMELIVRAKAGDYAVGYFESWNLESLQGVIDVRSLSPFDFDTIGASVRKTGRVVIVEEEPKTGGVGAELSASVAERFGGGLKAPVVRVASPDVPVPFAPVLENAFRPGPARIVEGVRQIMQN